MGSSTVLNENTEGKGKKLYVPSECLVESVRDLTDTEKLFRIIRLDGRPFGHKPGQFMQVSIPGAGEAPISVSSSPTRGPYLELGVRKAGRVTGVMHHLQKGGRVGIRGPFGTFFDVDFMQGRDLLLVAGGCGLAPMRALVQYIEDRRNEFGKVTLLYGAKSPRDLMYKDELAQWQGSAMLDCRVTVDRIPEDSRWEGNVGVITTLMPSVEIDPAKTIAVIVGPPVMYKYVFIELSKRNLNDKNIILSLERYMKCGVGKCGHCTIEHLYCCLDGPVFTYDRIRDLKGAI